MSAKPITLVINTNHPEWMVTDQSDTLGKWGLGMEAEVSYFNKEEFFKNFFENPRKKALIHGD
eukprot:gnl/Chilomastix_caulleri/4950.p1 GENE.gnl/Chilomastix_caulleri/4950~~gnl/Chilomastix_caulleri/4950.p1  ORF type:complete len:63 (+),score=1.50 gnl/Chilomastix_caulleri/4950:145-333(+)